MDNSVAPPVRSSPRRAAHLTVPAHLAAVTLVTVVAVTGFAPTAARQPPFSPDLHRDAVVRVMTAVADWQLAHPARHAPDDWTQAAFYSGVMALTTVVDEPRFLQAMRDMGEKNQWRPGPRPGHADDYAVVATYAQIYAKDRDRRQIAPSLALFDYLALLRYDESLAWGGAIAVQPDGKLGWVQPIAAEPGSGTADTTEPYGVGSFLLAGSEIVRLGGGAPAREE